MDTTIDINVQTDCIESIGGVDFHQTLISDQEWQHWFEQWIVTLDPDLSPICTYALGLRLTNDEQMQHFNATFRHVNQPTDVLAFASLEREALPAEIWNSQPLELGDIIISVETAQRQAQAQHHSLKQEIAWLASHGLLHLLGWDHPTTHLLKAMLIKQATLLSQVGLCYEVKNCINGDI